MSIGVEISGTRVLDQKAQTKEKIRCVFGNCGRKEFACPKSSRKIKKRWVPSKNRGLCIWKL